VLVIFSTNFAVGNLQLSVKKLQRPAPNFLSPSVLLILPVKPVISTFLPRDATQSAVMRQ